MSPFPTGLAQTVDHVCMVFRPHPRHAPANTALKGGWHDRHGLLQRLFRFVDPTELTERGGEPTVRWAALRRSVSSATG